MSDRSQVHDHLFSLLELVTAVIVICLTLVGIIGVARHTQHRTRSRLTRSVVFAALADAAEQHRRKTGRLPLAEEGDRPDEPIVVRNAALLSALAEADVPLTPEVPPLFFRQVPDPLHPHAAPLRVLCDAWGTPVAYQLLPDAAGAAAEPLLISAGPNRRHRDTDEHDNLRSDEPY